MVPAVTVQPSDGMTRITMTVALTPAKSKQAEDTMLINPIHPIGNSLEKHKPCTKV